jgi:UrcA family protein
MSIIRFSNRVALAGLSALALAAGAASLPAHAQPGYDAYAYPPGDQVTVQAPIYHRSYPFRGEATISESRGVYYGDLDLTTDWGARALHARVERAAVRICHSLADQPGLLPADTETCIDSAVYGAMERAPIPGPMRWRYEYVDDVY